MAGVTPARARQYFPDDRGAPLAMGSVEVFYAGTLDHADTYADKALTTLNQNPVPLNARGECVIYLAPFNTVKWIVRDRLGNTVYTDDDVLLGGDTPFTPHFNVDRFSGDGSQKDFTLSTTPSSENNTSVYVANSYVQKNAYSVAGDVLTFAAAPVSGTDNIEVVTIELVEFAAAADLITAEAQAAQEAADAAAAAANASEAAAASSAVDAAGSATLSASHEASAAAVAAALPTNLGRRFLTYAELAAVSGLSSGTPGEVTSDAGTHTDPVVGGTVANQGIFRYSTSPAGWQRIGTSDITSLTAAAAALADEVTPPADGNTYLAISTDGETVLAINNTTETLYGSAVDSLGVQPPEPWRAQALYLATAPVKYTAAEGWNHIMHGGQSNPAGSADGAEAASTSQPYSNITFNGGTRADGTTFAWTATKPLIEEQQGTLSESPSAGSAEMSSNYAARKHGIATSAFVQFASVAATGGLTIAQLSKGSGTYNRMLGQVTQAKALATAAGKSYNIQAVCWGQGESDAVSPALTPRATYSAAFQTLISDTNTDLKAIKVPQDDVHFLVAQCSYWVTNALSINTALAQLDVIQSNAKAHLSHPTYFLPHDEDDTHRTVVGHKLEGAYFGRAYAQLVLEGRKPDCLWPLGGFASGTELRIRFRVPTYPLKFDIVNLQKVQDFGIVVVDDTGTLTLSGHRIDGGDTVVVTLNRTLGTNPRLRLALDYLPWNMTAAYKGITNGAVTNIRDSSPETFTITYEGVTTTFPLYHWCPHYEGAISVLVS